MASWQNGIAEKRIRDLVDKAQTILLAIHLALWPYALRYANHLHMSKPLRKDNNEYNRSPLEIFADSPVRPNLDHFHPFGCLTYVLDAKLQQQNALDRWLPRARVGINLGFSAHHARNVALILNPTTGLVSPQFHCRYDDFCETINDPRNVALDPSQWQAATKLKLKQKGNVLRLVRLTTTQPQQANELEDVMVPSPDELENPTNPTPPSEGGPSPSEGGTVENQPTRTSTRLRSPSRRMLEHYEAYPVAFAALTYPNDQEESCLPEHDPFCYAATSNRSKKAGGDPDTLSFRDAMNQTDKEHFLTAMIKEIQDHSKRKHWKIVPRAMVPKGHPVARAVWSMKRKRHHVTGEIYKYKSRVTYDGSQQIRGINYWETFSPVVNAYIVKLIVVIALTNDWYKHQIDFVLAYPHAPAPTNLFMEIPKGFTLPNGMNRREHCLQLLRNLYGTKQGGKAWFDYLCQKLTSIGFTPSSVDPCLWYRGRTLLLFYVDNTWIFAPTKTETTQVFHDLDEAGCSVEDEGEAQDFLGISFMKQTDGSYELTQFKLIQQILDDMNFQDNTKAKDKPAKVNFVSQRDEHLPEHKET